MPAVTNLSPGPRGFALAGRARVTLAPGETQGIAIDPAHPVLAAWAAAGEILVAAPAEIPAPEGTVPADAASLAPASGDAGEADLVPEEGAPPASVPADDTPSAKGTRRKG